MTEAVSLWVARIEGTGRPAVTLPMNRCSGHRDRAQRRLPQPLFGKQEAGRGGLPGASWTNLQEAKRLGLRVAPSLDKRTTSPHSVLPDANIPR